MKLILLTYFMLSIFMSKTGKHIYAKVVYPTNQRLMLAFDS